MTSDPESLTKTVTFEVPARAEGTDVTLILEWNPWGALVGGELSVKDWRTADGLYVRELGRQAAKEGARSEDDLRRLLDGGWLPTADAMTPEAWERLGAAGEQEQP